MCSNSKSLFDQSQNKLIWLIARGPPSQLWGTILVMVSIAVDFIRAERLRLFTEHQDAVREMLPYIHASSGFFMPTQHIYICKIQSNKR